MKTLIKQAIQENSKTSLTGTSFDLLAVADAVEQKKAAAEQLKPELAAKLRDLQAQLQAQMSVVRGLSEAAHEYKTQQYWAQENLNKEVIRFAATQGLKLGTKLNLLPGSLKKLTPEQQAQARNTFNTVVIPYYNEQAKKYEAKPTAAQQAAQQAYNCEINTYNKLVDEAKQVEMALYGS